MYKILFVPSCIAVLFAPDIISESQTIAHQKIFGKLHALNVSITFDIMV